MKLDTLGGRRFLLSLVFGLITAFLVYKKAITPEVYEIVELGIVGAYITGNVYQRKIEAK
jgi:uncharacterized membrane protein YeaQ/YmgE (transglycosylase-associated protein family)